MHLWWIPPALWLAAVVWQSWQARRAGHSCGRGRVRAGARRLYSRRRFLQLGGGIVVAGALAYSGADEAIEDWHARRVKGRFSDALSGWLHEYGERFWFFYWAAVAALDHFVASTPLTRHGRRSFEAILIGLPILWSAQFGLGAARPSDNTHGPRWRFLADQNSASGHTFLSLPPWLVAIRQLPSPAARLGCALAAPWVGWSRLNDRKHYLGQILLGGWIAFLAVDSVNDQPDSQ